MDETRPPRDPTQPGPVAQGQLERARELARRVPNATREQVAQELEAPQRARPEDVEEERPAAPATAGERPVPRPEPDAEPGPEAARSPFVDAATSTRDSRSEAG